MPRSRFDSFESLLKEVLAEQRMINPKLESFMSATQSDLDSVLATVNTDFAALQSANQQILTKLQSVTPGQPAPDFTNEINLLQTLDAGLNALSTADTTALNPPASTSPATPSAQAKKA